MQRHRARFSPSSAGGKHAAVGDTPPIAIGRCVDLQGIDELVDHRVGAVESVGHGALVVELVRRRVWLIAKCDEMLVAELPRPIAVWRSRRTILYVGRFLRSLSPASDDRRAWTEISG